MSPEELAAALKELSVPSGLAVVVRHVHGTRSMAKTATDLGITQAAVSYRCHRVSMMAEKANSTVLAAEIDSWSLNFAAL